MSASTSRSPACSRRAWWCTRPISTADGEWVTPAEVKIESDGDARRDADRDRRAGRDRRHREDVEVEEEHRRPRRHHRHLRRRHGALVHAVGLAARARRRMDRARRAGRLALRAAAVAADRRGRPRSPSRRPAERPAAFGEPALALRKAAHGALAKVSGRDREAALQRLRRPHLRVRQCARLGHWRRCGQRRNAATPDFAWAVREAADILVRLFHPMMPHLAEECWAALGHTDAGRDEPWPRSSRTCWSRTPSRCRSRSTARSAPTSPWRATPSRAEIEAAVLALDAVQRALDGKRPKKVIVVPQRIVNVVA